MTGSIKDAAKGIIPDGLEESIPFCGHRFLAGVVNGTLCWYCKDTGRVIDALPACTFPPQAPQVTPEELAKIKTRFEKELGEVDSWVKNELQ